MFTLCENNFIKKCFIIFKMSDFNVNSIVKIKKHKNERKKRNNQTNNEKD